MREPEPGSLLAFLAEVPDPRDRPGRRHALVTMLAHACCAILCGCRGYAAIAQWGRDQPIELMHRLGYRRRPPAYGAFQRLFTRLDAAAFEAAIARWADRLLPAAGGGRLRAVAIDGKSSRGSRTADAPAVHLLAALDQETGCVPAQARVPAETNEHKAALRLLEGPQRDAPGIAEVLGMGRRGVRGREDQGRSERGGDSPVPPMIDRPSAGRRPPPILGVRGSAGVEAVIEGIGRPASPDSCRVRPIGG